MTRLEQLEFVESFTRSVCTSLIANVKYVPEDWDGFELRRWIADTFQFEVHKMPPSRARKYMAAYRRLRQDHR